METIKLKTHHNLTLQNFYLQQPSTPLRSGSHALGQPILLVSGTGDIIESTEKMAAFLRVPKLLLLLTLILSIGAAVAATTKSGCECQSDWQYREKTFTGGSCGNPDNDIRGPWCFVTEKPCAGLCVNQPFGSIQGASYDHCPNWESAAETEIIPGELVGRWEGFQVQVGEDGKQSTSTPAVLCATKDSPELNLGLKDAREIHIIQQVICTGLFRGYFFSNVQGNMRCNKFVLDPSSSSENVANMLSLTSHLESNPYDCSPLDNPGSKLQIETFSSMDNQMGTDAWLCQPRLPPGEVVGRWDGVKKIVTGNDGKVTECAVTLSNLNTNGLTVSTSDACADTFGPDENIPTEFHIFDAHVDVCTTKDGTTESTGTLLAYSADGREYCYRFRRSTDGSLKISYQTTRYPQKLHHVCPDTIDVSKDVAQLELNLVDAGIAPSAWLCNDPQRGLPLASEAVDNSISKDAENMGEDTESMAEDADSITEDIGIMSEDSEGINKGDTIIEKEKIGGGVVMIISITAVLLASSCLVFLIIYKINNRRVLESVTNPSVPHPAEADTEFDGTRDIT